MKMKTKMTMTKMKINKFDKLIEFVKNEVSTRGADAIAKEINDFMVDRYIVDGITVDEFLKYNPSLEES